MEYCKVEDSMSSVFVLTKFISAQSIRYVQVMYVKCLLCLRAFYKTLYFLNIKLICQIGQNSKCKINHKLYFFVVIG